MRMGSRYQMPYDHFVAGRPTPPPGRSETRETAELRALKERQPELGDAVDMHLELLEVQRRVQGRIPLPSFELNAAIFARHQESAAPLLRFEDIPLELTDLRLVVRQTADILRRFGALDEAEYQQAQAVGRDAALTALLGEWYRAPTLRHASPVGHGPALGVSSPGPFDQLFNVAMRPFLSRCAAASRTLP
jgi:hypothetical protein